MLDSIYLWHQNILFSDLNSHFHCASPWHIQSHSEIHERIHYSPQQWYCLYWYLCGPSQPETTGWGLGKCWSADTVLSKWRHLVTCEYIVNCLVNWLSIMKSIANFSIDQPILCLCLVLTFRTMTCDRVQGWLYTMRSAGRRIRDFILSIWWGNVLARWHQTLTRHSGGDRIARLGKAFFKCSLQSIPSKSWRILMNGKLSGMFARAPSTRFRWLASIHP